MPSSQFVKGNVPDESSIFSGNLYTALQSNSNSFSTVLLLKLSCFWFYNWLGTFHILVNDLWGLWLWKERHINYIVQLDTIVAIFKYNVLSSPNQQQQMKQSWMWESPLRWVERLWQGWWEWFLLQQDPQYFLPQQESQLCWKNKNVIM